MGVPAPPGVGVGTLEPRGNGLGDPAGGRRRLRLWVAAAVVGLGALVLIAVAFGLVPGLGRRSSLHWPSEGLAIEAGTPEAAVDAFMRTLASGDLAGAAGWFALERMGADREAATAALTRSQAEGGGLERWLVVGRADGEPVLVTVYCRFARQGDVVLRAEVYGQAGEWRLGNVRSVDQASASYRPPKWETGSTAHLGLFVWPGQTADLEFLLASGEKALDQAFGPLVLGPDPLPPAVTEAVSVYVYDSLAHVKQATGRDYPEWFAGTVWWQSTPGDGSVLVLSSRALERNGQDRYEILVHETNHLLVIRYVYSLSGGEVGAGAIPSWLTEGMAGLAAGQLSGSRRSAFAARVTGTGTELPDLSELVTSFDINTVEGCYDYAFSLAEYLTRRFGPDTPRKTLEAIARGLQPLDALEVVTGQRAADLTAAWHEWLRAGLNGP